MAPSRTDHARVPLLGILLVLLLGPAPTALEAQRPDSRALAAAEELVKQRASAGQVATEMSRSYRQSATQTAMILREVGFRAADATSALARDLRLDPARAVPALREARYEAGGVAAGLAGARISPDRIVAALGTARYPAAEIVGAQRSALGRDATSAWADLVRSGLVASEADAFLEAFLELNVRNRSGASETHAVLRTVARDVRSVAGKTAGETLAWLSGETSMEEALAMVEEEYGLDAEGLVATIVEATGLVQGAFDELVAFQILLMDQQHESRMRVIQAMAVENVPRSVIVNIVLTILAVGTAGADLLVEAGIWTRDQAAEALLATGMTGQEVADWMVEGGATAHEAADWLAETGGRTAEEVAGWMLDAGATAEEAAAWLISTGIDAAATALALKNIGVKIRDVVSAVRDRVSWSVEGVASWLADQGYDAATVASVLKDSTGATRGDVVEALEEAGFPASDIWPAMVSAFDLSSQELAELMADAGAALNDIAAALVDHFTLSMQEALAIAAQVLGGG